MNNLPSPLPEFLGNELAKINSLNIVLDKQAILDWELANSKTSLPNNKTGNNKTHFSAIYTQ